MSVFNGSGQRGLAAKTQNELINEGFVATGVGNKRSVRATQVRYRASAKDKAAVVQSYLGGVGKLIEDNSVTEVDVDIVLGKDFTGVTAPAGAPTGVAPAAPAASAPPSAPPSNGGAASEPGGPAADPTQC